MITRVVFYLTTAVLVFGVFYFATNYGRSDLAEVDLPEVNPVQTTTNESVVFSQSIKAEQVIAHNQPTDCWVVDDNLIYDVTEWLADNSQPKEVLSECGRVESKLNSTDMQELEITQDYLIGELSPQEENE